jgi:hypothetical protein
VSSGSSFHISPISRGRFFRRRDLSKLEAGFRAIVQDHCDALVVFPDSAMYEISDRHWSVISSTHSDRSCANKPMKKISEYKQHAEECRMLARQTAVEKHRQMLLEMAATWEMLAENRANILASGRQVWESIVLPLRPSILDGDILALGVEVPGSRSWTPCLSAAHALR